MISESGFFNDILRCIFGPIVYFCFELIEWILYGMFDIAALKTSEGLIGDIYMRIYVILGIFMAFKLIVSFLNYMINPDSMADKEKGAGKLIARVVTMLALIIMLPQFFPLLNKVQTEFLPILPRVILGSEVDSTNTVEDNAKIMSSAVLSVVYRPNLNLDEDKRPPVISDIDDFIDTLLDDTRGYYDYEFNWLLGIAVGVVLVIILVSMTIKVAIRLFKMFILELIAPIPVMNYIDPKASKDGAFASWVKQLTSTFLDIFIRLGVIYIVVMILGYFSEGSLFAPESLPDDPIRVGYLNIFLIIALLMFAKDAPNFIKDAFGIKHDKDTSGGLAAATGFISGGATGAVSGLISGRGIRGAVTGAATGASAGWQGGMTGKKANAWSVAGDAALQARTGDSKAKSGVLASMQRNASKAQLSSSARKLNITNDTIEQAKQNMLEMQAIAAEAERNWNYGIQTQKFFDLEGNRLSDYIDANGNTVSAMEQAAAIVAATSTDSAIAAKNYDKMNKAGDAYGVNRSFAEDLRYEQQQFNKSGKTPNSDADRYKAKGQANPRKSHKDRADYTGRP